MSAIFDQAAFLWVEMRSDFGVVLEAAYEAAETATNGFMLNKRGRAAGIDPWSLLTGPWVRVTAYGSEELIAHFESVGRPNLELFEREWLASRQAMGAAA